MAANVEEELQREVPETGSSGAAFNVVGSDDAVPKGDGSQDAGSDDGSKAGGSKDVALADTGSQEGASQDAVPGDGVSKDAVSDAAGSKDAGSDAAGSHECASKAVVSHGGGAKEGGAQESCFETLSKDGAADEAATASKAGVCDSGAKDVDSNAGASKGTAKPEARPVTEECIEGPSSEKRSRELEPQESANTEPKKRFYTCNCFYSKNIFVPEYELFVTYTTKAEFWRQYSTYLVSKGCDSEKFTKIVNDINNEITRRKALGQHFIERKLLIQQLYKPLHPHVYNLQPSFLTPEFRELVSYCKSHEACFDGILQRVEEVKAERMYVFPIFTEDFCRDFLEELQHFEASDVPKTKPNSMNTYGVNLDELGCDEGLISPLREDYLCPVTALLYPDKGGGSLDSHKAFIVKYTSELEPGLALHFDNAEVTLNVCLGKDFTGGNLYLVDVRKEQEGESVEIENRKGYGILHRSQQMHGAKPITAGERLNLIMWMRCSFIRNKKCPMCKEPPVLQETEGFGDGFTKEPSQVNFCSLT